MAEILNFVNRIDIKANPEGINQHEGNIKRIKTQPESKRNIIQKVSELPIHSGLDVNKIMASIRNKKVLPIISTDQNKTCLVKEEGHKINLTSKMIEETLKSRDSVCSEDGLENRAYDYTEPKEEETEKTNEDINADTIRQALQIFKNSEDKDSDEEMPAFMQVSGEIKNEEEKPAEGKPSETENTQTATVGKDFGVPSHENSGYLDGINAFKAQIGTDKYEHTSNRDFAAHINSEPQVSKYEEQPMSNFTVHTNENPMNINGSAAISTNTNDSNTLNIDDIVKGYYPLGNARVRDLGPIKEGCEGYVQQARADKMQAVTEINEIDAQIDKKDKQIASLYLQIKNLESEKTDLDSQKQTWQTAYSDANTRESLGESKIDEINEFVYQEFNSMNNQMDNNSSYSNSYSSQGYSGGMEDSGYSRGRRAA